MHAWCRRWCSECAVGIVVFLQLNTKRTTGIPGDELMETTADDPMAMLTPGGKYVVPIMHWRARNSKRPDTGEIPLSQRVVPPELTCGICNGLLKEAMLTACCGESFCAECVSAKLMEVTECPNCKREGVGVDQLVPNKNVRLAVESWIGQSQQPSAAGLAEQAQPLPPDRKARTRLRIGIGASSAPTGGGSTPLSEADTPSAAEGSLTPGQEVFKTEADTAAAASPAPKPESVEQPPATEPAPPGLATSATSLTTTVVVPAPATVPPPQTTTTVPVPVTNAIVPIAPFQPNVPPPPIPPAGGTVVLIDPITQQPIFNPGGHTIVPGAAVYQATPDQLAQEWQEYLNRNRKKSRTPKKKRRKRSRSGSSDSSSSSSSGSSSSSESSRDRDRRRRKDDRRHYSDRDRYGRDGGNSYYRGARGGGRSYRGRAGFSMSSRAGPPPMGTSTVRGYHAVPAHQLQVLYDQQGNMVMQQPYMGAAGNAPKSLLDGDIVPPSGLVYVDQMGNIVDPSVALGLDGRDPRDSRPPMPRGGYHGSGGYRGRGRREVNYERMENDRRYRDEQERRRRPRDDDDERSERRRDERDDRRHNGSDRHGSSRGRRVESSKKKDRGGAESKSDRSEDDDDRKMREEEEREIEATIKDLESQMCEGPEKRERRERRKEGDRERGKDRGDRDRDRHRERGERGGSREGREDRRRRRKDERSGRRTKEEEEGGEKENDKDASGLKRGRRRSGEEAEEGAKGQEMEEKDGDDVRMKDTVVAEGQGDAVPKEKLDEASQGSDDAHREKKHKKHKKHKKEKKAKKDKKKSDDEDDLVREKKDAGDTVDGDKKEGEANGDGGEGEDKERERKRKHKKSKKEKKEKKAKRERADSVSDEEERERRRKRKEEKAAAKASGTLHVEPEAVPDRIVEMVNLDSADEKTKHDKSKAAVDIKQVFQQAPIVQKKITLHLSK